LSWDSLESRKCTDGIEKAKASPSKKQLAEIKGYLKKPRELHEDARSASIKTSKSMVAMILEQSNSDLVASLSETQHAQCLEYLSALLAVRDRDEIANALCRQNPDLFTQAIKDAVASFEPMIRAVHQRVDLREHASAAERFLTDFINVSKAKKSASGFLGSSKGDTAESRAPSVEDYVTLLRRNRQLLYNWLHQVASQCPDIRDDFCAWAKETMKVFRQSKRAPPTPQADLEAKPTDESNRTNHKTKRRGAAGALSSNLQHLFASLPPETRSRILPAIDAHADYLTTLEHLSLTRMQHILDNMNTTNNNHKTAPTTTSAPSTPNPTPSTSSYFSSAYWSGKSSPVPSRSAASSPNPLPNPPTATEDKTSNPNTSTMSMSGPGMYLAHWQQLLDDTLVAPASASGPLRRGRDVLMAHLTPGKMGPAGGGVKDGGGVGGGVALLERELEQGREPRPPDVGVVVEVLGRGFRELVGGLLKP
jgi:hypothetical protein